MGTKDKHPCPVRDSNQQSSGRTLKGSASDPVTTVPATECLLCEEKATNNKTDRRKHHSTPFNPAAYVVAPQRSAVPQMARFRYIIRVFAFRMNIKSPQFKNV
jgi:hypothetical protein